MSLREILIEPNEILRQKSLFVEKVDADLQKLMNDMLETMYAAPGIGLAAIQIGVPKRVIVLDIAKKDEPKNPIFFINPEIIEKSKNNSTYEEGCLSVPGQFAEIDRPEKCHIRYFVKRPNSLYLYMIKTNIIRNRLKKPYISWKLQLK